MKKFLGSGSFADVYLVNHNFLDDLRAIKIIKQPLNSSLNVQNVFHEVKIVTRLRNDHIISIYDAGIISNKDDLAYFVMEYVPGGDLEQYLNSFIKSDLFMPINRALDLIKQILLGLNTLHSSEPTIVHRDLKLNNILLSYDACGDIVIKISDFGFAKEITTDISDIDVAGTRPYMAPECFNKEISTMSDIYAIGVIFYQLLTNRYPYNVNDFEIDDFLELKPWQSNIKPPSYFNSSVSADLDKLIMKCLDINPINRFMDAAELLSEVEIILDKIESDEIMEDYIDESEENDSDYLLNESLKKAFLLAKCENRLNEAIEILEHELLNDYNIRKVYGETLRMWKSKRPDLQLISKAFTVNLKGNNYDLSCNLLKEAIAYNPSIKSQYWHYLELWSIFIDLNRYNNLIKAVISLENLMQSNEFINDIYAEVINTLKTFSINEIIDESLRLANLNYLSDAALLMEFAVVYNSDIKREYAYQLSLWKQNIKLDFKKQDRSNISTIDYAIDLGTVDSIVSYFNDGNPLIIKNHLTGEDFTPSAVFIDGNSNIQVGETARDVLLENSDDAVTEFKHNMGFNVLFKFEKSSRILSPEELSCEVLKDLRVSVYKQCGVNMKHAVICVPANSNPIKTRAVNDAAKLAGFKSHTLIFEPIAVAIAYDLKKDDENNGVWMIYDLGGGTFNITLINDSNGEIEKIATKGLDNLGGNEFDWAIVEELFAPKIINDLKLSNFIKNNPKYVKAFSKLKKHAEIAKKDLTNSNRSEILIKNLFEGYDFRYDMLREDLKKIIRPYIMRTFNLCNSLLEENNLSIDEIDSMILVGGSCLSPVIKEIIQFEFELHIEDSLNPLTVVSRGASIYAGNLEIPTTDDEYETFSLIIDAEKQMGRLFSLDNTFLFLGFTIEFKKDDFSSGKIPVDPDGTFEISVNLDDDYSIEVYNKNHIVGIDFEFKSLKDKISLNELFNKYESLLKRVNYLEEYGCFNDYGRLNYIERLTDMAKIDEMAVSPANACLNRLELVLEELENEFEFNILLENVKNKIMVINNNDLFDIEGFDLNQIIKDKNLNGLKEVYTNLIREYVILNRDNVIKSVFFNLWYDGIYTSNQHIVDELIKKALGYLNNSDYMGLFSCVNKLYELDERK